jgi:hypothetical protein
LIEAVFQRRVAGMNRERLQMLDSLEAQFGDRPVPLEDVIRAFLLPVMNRHCAGGVEEAIPRLMGRAFTETEQHPPGAIPKAFEEIAMRFGKAVARAMPGLSREEVEWRFLMVVGAMVFTVIRPRFHPEEAKQRQSSCDPDETTERLVRFLAAGMRAPTPEATGKGTK